jgi:thermitase
MDSLHETLARKQRWYAAWHASRNASLFNFTLLSAFVALTVFTISNPLVGYGNDMQLAAAITAPAVPVSHYVPGRLLVQFKAGVTDADQKGLIASSGAAADSSIPQIKTLVLKVPVGAETKVRDALLHNPRVEVAELDYLVDAKLVPNDTLYPQQWYSPVINEPAGWDITTGSSSVVVAIVDTGLVAHPEVAANIVPGYNVYSNSTLTNVDPCAHGTAVASIAGGIGNNANGIAGVAWHVSLMPVVISDDSSTTVCNSTSMSYLAKGVTYAADHGARVINVSWGGTGDDATMQSAVNYAWGKGAVVFAAAGNNGATPVLYPAGEQNVVAVAATGAASTSPSGDTHASYSNYGSGVDVAAPGSSIWAPYAAVTNGSYSTWTGTSMATPMASGLAALMLSVNPKLTNAQIVDLMEKNSDDLGTAGWDQYYGWGRIDVAKTLRAAGGAVPVTDTTAPVTSVVSPVAGATVSGLVTVAVSASDNVGVTKVELYKDGTLYATSTMAPYSFFWDSTTASDGAHTLYTKAYDAANNTASSATVSVTNDAPLAPDEIHDHQVKEGNAYDDERVGGYYLVCLIEDE